jgi:hypothetical protein
MVRSQKERIHTYFFFLISTFSIGAIFVSRRSDACTLYTR